MSHFAVLVIGEDVDSQLAPYQENNTGNCPQEYLEFNDVEDEERLRYENEGTEMVLVGGKYVYPWDEQFRVPGTFGTGGGTHTVPAPLKEVKVPFKEMFKTFEDFMRDWSGYKGPDEKTGRYGYWENPNAKWDFYRVGGRYAGRLVVRPGVDFNPVKRDWDSSPLPNHTRATDEARVGDLDIAAMVEERRKQAEYWWAKMEESIKKNPGHEKSERYFLGIPENATRDEFIKDYASKPISALAVVKDGKWYEKGEMGWWGIIHNEKDDGAWDRELQSLIKDLPADTLLTFVDCHI